MKKEHLNPASTIERRQFLKTTAGIASFFIVPRHVLGGRGFTAPSDMVSLGFIGTGKQSGSLRRNFLQTGEAQILAACDVHRTKLNTFVDAVKAFYTEKGQPYVNGIQTYSDFRELLSRNDIDAVVIAAPDHWHSALAIKAAAAGKDVYCEKPLALTVAEGRAMVDAVRKHKRVLQTGSMQRSWSEFRQAVELVRNGYIGELKTIRVNVGGPPKDWDLAAEPTPEGLDWNAWLGPNTIERPYNNQLAPPLSATFWPNWRMYKEFGGGGMTDWGAHMFDIAQWGMDMDGSGPTEIIPTSEGGKPGLTYRYANGVTMLHAPVDGKQYCHFIGTEGEVKVARGELTTTPASLKDKPMGESDKRVYFSDNHYKDFFKAIRTRQKPICDVEVGHRTASVCNIGNIAYQLNRPLRWNPEKEKFTGDAEANRLLSRPMRKV
ncbi:Gfo/Idh/MocA family protein [Nibrella viscosa]